MLVLTRKVGETIVIDDEIVITILKIQGRNAVSIGIQAPRDKTISRGELVDEDKEDEDEEAAEESLAENEALC